METCARITKGVFLCCSETQWHMCVNEMVFTGDRYFVGQSIYLDRKKKIEILLVCLSQGLEFGYTLNLNYK